MNRRLSLNGLLLIFSLLCVYILAPDLDRRDGHLGSIAFALILILNSRIVWQAKFVWRYLVFIGIDLLTYFILFNDQPWDFLFSGGLFESSPAPIIICSLIMSLAGGLLLKSWPDRLKYFFITSGLQIPIAFFVGVPSIESFFSSLSDMLLSYHHYFGAWVVWQFEWMLIYYLPIYFLNLKYSK